MTPYWFRRLKCGDVLRDPWGNRRIIREVMRRGDGSLFAVSVPRLGPDRSNPTFPWTPTVPYFRYDLIHWKYLGSRNV